ncbi:MAG: ATP-binding cassette domain-containing protein [Anaerolineae bacterium]|nr:ATP-binding cassette domain-containing protein [Anaerolineae bacterium]NIN94406.1 ATP-binding cassette domain-containing protein [Anaerolineae bacterium]NIQ77472.1 ATP-binding cassette domain-containing protein [Anaerolineae bacterium]
MSSYPSTVSEIELRQVTKAFRVNGKLVTALDHVNLVARAGEFVVIIGPSGCGKSTLLNIICGLMEPDSGEVLLDGRRVRDRTGLFGYMLQKDLLLPWRRVLDNVILGQEIGGFDRKAARKEAEGLLPLFGLEGFEHSYPATLSGGMRQRAALLRTFLCKRNVMLLDEPFGALDALTRRQLQQWLLDVWTRFRQTILFVTHDVDEAVYLADRVYVMTPRPGSMKLEVGVLLPRPRRPDMITSSRFASLKANLLATLESD